MTYLESLTFLGQARRFGMKLGLESMQALAFGLGNPERQLRFIHIAGTNGKGSVAAFTAAVLRADGYRVGLFTSPHLISLRERIQIDGVPISELELTTRLEKVRQAAELQKLSPTFFEWMVALGLVTFAENRVDFVVWETGMGGRLDATTIVTPEISVITTIGWDHQKYLGSTLSEIAGEKAGIIKPGRPVVCGVPASQTEVREVIQKRADDLGASLVWTADSMAHRVEDLGVHDLCQNIRLQGSTGLDTREVALSMLGSHQIANAACATACVEALGITDIEVIARGLRDTHWAGRCDILRRQPLLMLDGAHNPDGLRVLLSTWRNFVSPPVKQPQHLVFGCVGDKEWYKLVQQLRSEFTRISIVKLSSERSADPAQVAEAFSPTPCAVYPSTAELWPELVSPKNEEPTLITGSLFLAGEILSRHTQTVEDFTDNERLEPVALKN